VMSEDARERYEVAKVRRALIVAEWEQLGRPVMTLGGATGRAQVPHPLLKVMSDADGLCDRLEQALRRRGVPGRPPGAVSAPDRVEPPKLRRLKSV